MNLQKKKQVSIKELTKNISKSFNDDCRYLNCLEPSFQPKATDHIKEMINMILKLIESEHAYESNKHVYFSVPSYKNYGALSNKNSEELISGSRVEVSKSKKNPLDFVLWKPSEDSDPGWDSPWGRGRPGWHLECSVMSEKYLGKNFDIHGGGLDLVFPHHENEIAQSCCANKTNKFANYWIHNGFVTFDKEKMSKSVGNIVTINKLSSYVNGQVVRLALLSSHYKQPLDWNERLIDESKNTLNKWYKLHDEVNSDDLDNNFIHPLLEDLNTPKYISNLHKLYDEASKGSKSSKANFLKACNLLGFLEEDKKVWDNFKKSKVKIDENFINQKITDRNDARKKGNFKLADDIRKELENNGVNIEDTKDKTEWNYK